MKNENAVDISNGNIKPLNLSGKSLATSTKEIFSKQIYQNATNQMSNPFDAVMMMFNEVPLINMNTKDINIKIPMIGSEDITKYIAYMQTRVEANIKILDRRLSLTNNVLAFCGRTSREEAPKLIADLSKELAFISGSNDISAANKAIYITNIEKELRDVKDIQALTGDTTRKKFGNDFKYLGNNLQLTVEKLKQIPRLQTQKTKLELKKV